MVALLEREDAPRCARCSGVIKTGRDAETIIGEHGVYCSVTCARARGERV